MAGPSVIPQQASITSFKAECNDLSANLISGHARISSTELEAARADPIVASRRPVKRAQRVE